MSSWIASSVAYLAQITTPTKADSAAARVKQISNSPLLHSFLPALLVGSLTEEEKEGSTTHSVDCDEPLVSILRPSGKSSTANTPKRVQFAEEQEKHGGRGKTEFQKTPQRKSHTRRPIPLGTFDHESSTDDTLSDVDDAHKHSSPFSSSRNNPLNTVTNADVNILSAPLNARHIIANSRLVRLVKRKKKKKDREQQWLNILSPFDSQNNKTRSRVATPTNTKQSTKPPSFSSPSSLPNLRSPSAFMSRGQRALIKAQSRFNYQSPLPRNRHKMDKNVHTPTSANAILINHTPMAKAVTKLAKKLLDNDEMKDCSVSPSTSQNKQEMGSTNASLSIAVAFEEAGRDSDDADDEHEDTVCEAASDANELLLKLKLLPKAKPDVMLDCPFVSRSDDTKEEEEEESEEEPRLEQKSSSPLVQLDFFQTVSKILKDNAVAGSQDEEQEMDVVECGVQESTTPESDGEPVFHQAVKASPGPMVYSRCLGTQTEHVECDIGTQTDNMNSCDVYTARVIMKHKPMVIITSSGARFIRVSDSVSVESGLVTKASGTMDGSSQVGQIKTSLHEFPLMGPLCGEKEWRCCNDKCETNGVGGVDEEVQYWKSTKVGEAFCLCVTCAMIYVVAQKSVESVAEVREDCSEQLQMLCLNQQDVVGETKGAIENEVAVKNVVDGIGTASADSDMDVSVSADDDCVMKRRRSKRKFEEMAGRARDVPTVGVKRRRVNKMKHQKGDFVYCTYGRSQGVCLVLSCGYAAEERFYPSTYKLLWLNWMDTNDELGRMSQCSISEELSDTVNSALTRTQVEKLIRCNRISETGLQEIKRYKNDLYRKFFDTKGNLKPKSKKKSGRRRRASSAM